MNNTTPTKLFLKIHDYDPQSESLIVSFASDKTQGTVDHYGPIAYQPTIYENPHDVPSIIKHIAHSGIQITEDIVKREQFKENVELTSKYQQLVGKQLTFDVKDLLDFIRSPQSQQTNLEITEPTYQISKEEEI